MNSGSVFPGSDDRYAGDTIAGLATGPGRSEAAIVRISGPEALSLLDEVFTHTGKTDDSSFTFADGLLSLDDRVADIPCRVFIMKAPCSYTREDVVEFHIPGSPVLAEMLIEICAGRGIRRPDPGEFTKRAYLNGRIDLVRAIGVMEMIGASSREQLNGARNMLFGGVSETLARVENVIRKLTGLVELNIDFTDQNIDLFETENSFRNLIEQAQQTLNETVSRKLVTHTSSGEVHVIIAGMVNAGKSSLFNALLGFSRSTVSSVAGTTRDIIRGRTEISGLPFVLYDTAGLSDAPDLFEHKARTITQECGFGGMFMLLCVSPEMDVPENLLNLFLKEPGPGRTIMIGTKADLNMKNPIFEREFTDKPFSKVLFSSKSREDAERICSELVRLHSESVSGEQFYMSGILEHALRECSVILERVKNMNIAEEPELIAEELREALFLAGEFCHDDPGEEILNTIFSQFCIGK